MKASFKSILCLPLFSSEMPVKTSCVIYLSLIIITITTISGEREEEQLVFFKWSFNYLFPVYLLRYTCVMKMHFDHGINTITVCNSIKTHQLCALSKRTACHIKCE